MLELSFTILQLFQAAAFLAAVWFWRSYKHTTERYFLYFLTYVVLNEALAHAVQKYLDYPNCFLYNIYIIVSFTFYFYWFGLVLKETRHMKISMMVFLVSVGIGFFREDFFNDLWTTPMFVGSLLILFWTVRFFSTYLKDMHTERPTKDPRFWIASGLLIFHFGYLPINLMKNQLGPEDLAYGLILAMLNVVLNACYIISFLCRPKP